MNHYKLKPSLICNSIIFYMISLFFFSLEILPQTYFAVPSTWEEKFRCFRETENASNHPPAKLQFADADGTIRYFTLYPSKTPSDRLKLGIKVLLRMLWRFYCVWTQGGVDTWNVGTECTTYIKCTRCDILHNIRHVWVSHEFRKQLGVETVFFLN